MNIDQFWQIIEATRADTQEKQLELLKDELRRLSQEDLIQFEQKFVELKFAAYNWDLWLVAWLTQGGRCSDDGFADFRAWLISRGRATYETALEDADALVEEMRLAEDPDFELFGCVAGKIYREKTGESTVPDLGFRPPKEPAGGAWLRPELKDRTGSKLLNRCVVFNEMGDQEFAAIERRFPRIWTLCVERGIITPKAVATAKPSILPTPEDVAATVDPNLEKTDFAAYLKAINDAARKTYKGRE